MKPPPSQGTSRGCFLRSEKKTKKRFRRRGRLFCGAGTDLPDWKKKSLRFIRVKGWFIFIGVVFGRRRPGPIFNLFIGPKNNLSPPPPRAIKGSPNASRRGRLFSRKKKKSVPLFLLCFFQIFAFFPHLFYQVSFLHLNYRKRSHQRSRRYFFQKQGVRGGQSCIG